MSMISARVLVITLLGVSAAGAAWQRHVLSGKGGFFDTPAPHPISWFTQDPFLRDDGDDFCTDCTPRGKGLVHREHKFKTQLLKVGDLRGLAIYDLFYYFDDHIESKQIDWKSILVSVSPAQFREIYHLQPVEALIEPAYFLKAGADELLATRDAIPGTGNNYYEDYWWFGPDGPVRIDIESISEVVKSLLPAGYGVWKGGGLDMKALSYRSPVWRSGDANCCPTGGTVDLKLRIDRGQLSVTARNYDPK